MEAETGVLQPQAKKLQEPPEAGEGKKSLPWSLQKALLTPGV